ncbi:MAG TPA: aminoglycoside phosphotransferase family protein [bacterium]|nr:aminoglycoside phosphotransferase family protein [bacterium]HPT29437.1 aminoglycoside phosphotransferase family protein [bacterium]
MNKAYKLFDEQYILSLLRRKLPAFYPDFPKVRDIKIISHKKNVWTKTYHVVVEYSTILENKAGQTTTVPIFCAAHSSEPRKTFFLALDFLWRHGFAGDRLSIPHPLFFSDYFNAVFYRGVEGYNLHHYLYRQDKPMIEEIVSLAGQWFARLHSLAVNEKVDFPDGFIPAVVPGMNKVLDYIADRYPDYLDFYKKAYAIFTAREEKFKQEHSERCLVHGDAHPDNIIRINDGKVALIDLNDLSWGDPARDLGCFCEQLSYMGQKEGLSEEYLQSLEKMFLDNYFAHSHLKLDQDLQERIANYSYWTMIRTTSYQLLSNTVRRDVNKLKRIDHRINRLKIILGI